MDDYISREAVAKMLRYCVALEERDSKPTKAVDILMEFYRIPAADVVEKEKYDRLLENALIVSASLQEHQKADVVEVVRCRECVFFDGTKPGQPNILCFQMHENDYCSYGERKDGAKSE